MPRARPLEGRSGQRRSREPSAEETCAAKPCATHVHERNHSNDTNTAHLSDSGSFATPAVTLPSAAGSDVTQHYLKRLRSYLHDAVEGVLEGAYRVEDEYENHRERCDH